MKTISIISGKGGTGKSSISVSISSLLAHCGFKTLIIDLDLFTHGLTFYSLGSSLDKISGSLSDIFMEEKNEDIIVPVIIPSEFTSGNLFILPSISNVKQSVAKSAFDNKYINLTDFRRTVDTILKNISPDEFEYVFIDTRGGTDYTSIGSALSSDYFIVVTEADKPSWKMGDFLINSIVEAEKNEKIHSKRMGFIINKNVLPSEDIEQYLRKKWGMPHVGTIPFDKSAIKYFQENRITIEEDPGCFFSKEIHNIVRDVFVSDKWTDRNINRLELAVEPGILSMIFNLFRN
ncbi:MAG: ParA family protein [Desulfobacterales bacterium]|nr:ParA family protein [Desulfobacterales bacterium]MCP4158694.1 ParA family protein [Deltaproteobacteria bacterium]